MISETKATGIKAKETPNKPACTEVMKKKRHNGKNEWFIRESAVYRNSYNFNNNMVKIGQSLLRQISFKTKGLTIVAILKRTF